MPYKLKGTQLAALAMYLKHPDINAGCSECLLPLREGLFHAVEDRV